MTTTTAPPGGHSTPLGLMLCVRESSPQDMGPVPPQTDIDIDRNESSKKRRFHPFRGLRKMFRRGGGGNKVRATASEEAASAGESCDRASVPEGCTAKDSHRSRSTSELLAGDDPSRRKSGGADIVTNGMYSGGGALSVSHDSVFTAEQRSTRGDSTSSDLDTAQSSSSLSIQQLMQHSGVRAELLDAVRRRGRGRGDTSEDEEDLGLPRSPCNSPTTTDKALKEHPTKSHSTCSDGSLLSMGSSEMDEDSFGQNSRHSSKLSLHDRRPSQATDSELELGTTAVTAPLSHSAARHKMAVRPKRTHGAPRRRRVQQLTASSALPTTPEVNEEVSTRSLTPEGSSARETIAELYSSSSTSMNKVWNASSSVVTETQLKSASLPPGLALPSGTNKLSRSRSNAGGRGAKEAFAEEDEPDDKACKEEKKKEESFFGRFLARRSGKKKKSKSEDFVDVQITSSKSTMEKSESVTTSSISYKHVEEKRTYSVDSGISKVPRSGPASRQRIQPIDIPASPDAFRQRRQQHVDVDVPMPPVNNSPEQPSFLDASPPKKKHVFLPKQTKVISPISTSPEKHTADLSSPETAPVPTPRTILPHQTKPVEVVPSVRTILPQSPTKPTAPEVIPAPRLILPHSVSPPKPSWPETSMKMSNSSHSEVKFMESSSKVEECKTKVKITGLSSYQQRVMSYNDDFDGVGFKSLDETSEDSSISRFSITKSQSFRSKSVLSSSQDHSSLPFTVNTSVYDTGSDSETFTDSLMSTTTNTNSMNIHASTEQQVSVNVRETENIENVSNASENEVRIINTNMDLSKTIQKPEIVEKPKEEIKDCVGKTIKRNSLESANSIIISNDKVDGKEQKLENKDDGITISCVNSQVQASVNTKSTNQVIVSISNPSEPVACVQEQLESSSVCNKTITETSVRETSSQVSVTKVQLKRESKSPDTLTAPLVPEFLKIQLNKVDAKPTTNVVLSTSNSFNKADEKPKQKSVLEIETDRESGEVVTDTAKRKFSTDDVEIIDKDTAEDVVEIPARNVTVTNVQPAVKISPAKSPTELVKQLPTTLIINNANNVQSRKSSLVSVAPISPTACKPLLKKKSISLELVDSIKKPEEKNLSINSGKPLASSTDQLSSSKIETPTKEKTASISDTLDTPSTPPDVILRKKSLVTQKRDKVSDEPELLKVFARRSLKLKDSDVETLSQQVLVFVENSENNNSEGSDSNKRDSDKENECSESPPEERKKSTFPVNVCKETPKTKEPLIESKFVETADVTLRKPISTINNKLSAFGASKYQRAVSMATPVPIDVNENNTSDSEKRRNKSYIEPKTEKKPVITNYRSHIMNIRDKDIEIKKTTEITKCAKTGDELITNVSLKNDFENEDYVPMFKRIQQRKEEWEKRAQQNMKKSVP